MDARFYFDEDSSYSDRLEALRRNGFHVLTAREAGLLGRTDLEHLSRAASEGLVLVSHNVGDFQRLHTEYMHNGQHHAGILLAAQEHKLSAGEFLRRLQRLRSRKSAEELRDALEFLSFWVD